MWNGKGTASFDPETAQLTYSTQGNEKGTVTIEISNLEVGGSTGESYQVIYADTDGREDEDIFDITNRPLEWMQVVATRGAARANAQTHTMRTPF